MSLKKPRFRLFAGPNGSGKSSLFEDLKARGVIHTELYIAADRIERDFKESGEFSFNAYRVKVDSEQFRNQSLSSGLTKSLKVDASVLDDLVPESGIVKLKAKYLKAEFSSYIAALIADYLVDRLIETKQSFCFETVLSHSDKIAKFDLADKAGYVTYLYFVTTSHTEINVDRVADRVRAGGHNVPSVKIRERYIRSLNNLKPAALKADKIFIVDNTSSFETICTADRLAGRLDISDSYPNWMKKFFDPESDLA